MPFVNVKLIEGVFDPEQKQRIVRDLTEAMVAIEGENMRPVTWVVVEEVRSGDWGIRGSRPHRVSRPVSHDARQDPGRTQAHVEQVVRDLSRREFLELMGVVHRVARAVEAVVAPERTYLLSLGSQQGNAHVHGHGHIAPLPPCIPFHRQQHHALMLENAVIPWSAAQAHALAVKLRVALDQQ